jgi:hypothetical protein
MPCGVKLFFAALLSVFTLTGISGAHATDRLKEQQYDFTVTWSVAPDMPLASGAVRLEEDSRLYTIVLDATAKLTVPRIDWRGIFATQGNIIANGRSPQRFERSSMRRTLREDVIVSWSDDPSPTTITWRIPSHVKIQREQVPIEEIVGAVDPLTFALGILDSVRSTNGESCEINQKTWDGARLFELTATTKEALIGSFTVCRVMYHTVKGLRKDNPWVNAEEKVSRFVRFEKKYGVWHPVSINISGIFLGFESEFITKLTNAISG